MIGPFLGTIASLAIAVPNIPATLPVAAPSVHSANIVQIAQRPKPPVKRRPESLGVRTSASSVFVADVASGSVLYAKDPHRVLPIASLTKLVTAMVYLDQRPDLKSTITFTSEDFDHQSKAVFEDGETLTAEAVLQSMLVGSVNASANALARVSGGQEAFVARMNQKMKELGLASPVFVEPSGVDPQNRASAADVAAILATAANYPEIRNFTKLSSAVVRGTVSKKEYPLKSTNLLLTTFMNKDPYKIVAAKTGSLPEAGYCMAQLTSMGDGREVVVVELGSMNHFSRYQDIKVLTKWAFDTFEWR